MIERTYKWYIEPKPNANEAIAAAIAGACGLDTSANMVPCADGIHHNLWECDKQLLRNVVAKFRIGLDFEVFRKEGNGKIVNVSFLFKRKRRVQMPKPIFANNQKAASP